MAVVLMLDVRYPHFAQSNIVDRPALFHNGEQTSRLLVVCTCDGKIGDRVAQTFETTGETGLDWRGRIGIVYARIIVAGKRVVARRVCRDLLGELGDAGDELVCRAVDAEAARHVAK